jgi:3-oxoacyl-[acyl-carrier protein] reductase
MSQLLKDKVALITGAANGIGAHFTEMFLAQGANVIACDIQTGDLQAKYKGNAKCSVVKLDVREPEQWKNLANQNSKIDYLLNIAGIIRPGFLQENSLDDIVFTIDINLKGTMYGCKIIGEKMMQQGNGHIINFASLAGIAPVQGLSVYTASKFGVRGFSLALAQELKPKNIMVSVVAPDATDTHMLDDQMNSPAAALTFSGGKILTVEDIWKEVYKEVIVGKTIELWIPFNRGAQAYLGATFPNAAGWLTQLLTQKGLKGQAAFRSKRAK